MFLGAKKSTFSSHYNKEKEVGKNLYKMHYNNQSKSSVWQKRAVLHQQCRAAHVVSLTYCLWCKQKFLTVFLYFPLLSSSPPSPLSFLLPSGRSGTQGMERRGLSRLCGIRYNPFCLILHHSEKACQACMAAIKDLQSQYLQACGNLGPRAEIYITKALFP